MSESIDKVIERVANEESFHQDEPCGPLVMLRTPDRDRLLDEVKRLRKVAGYADHRNDCLERDIIATSPIHRHCTCGLDALKGGG